jgi:hypothetical protein
VDEIPGAVICAVFKFRVSTSRNPIPVGIASPRRSRPWMAKGIEREFCDSLFIAARLRWELVWLEVLGLERVATTIVVRADSAVRGVVVQNLPGTVETGRKETRFDPRRLRGRDSQRLRRGEIP